MLYAKELENEGKSTVFPKTRAAYRVNLFGSPISLDKTDNSANLLPFPNLNHKDTL